MSLAFQAHLISLITEGVFERFPSLKVRARGGRRGLAAAAALAAGRLLEGAAHRGAVGAAKAVRVRASTTSAWARSRSSGPTTTAQLLQMFDMMDAEHVLMFSSDYPHWDFDSPDRAFPKLSPATPRGDLLRERAGALRPGLDGGARRLPALRAAAGRAPDRRGRGPLDRRVQRRTVRCTRCATPARTRAPRSAWGW